MTPRFLRPWHYAAGALAAAGLAALVLLGSRAAAEPDWQAMKLGPVLEQARQRDLLVVAVRAYPRPAPPESPLPPEPDDYDASVARYIARTLNVRLQLVNLPSPDEKTGPLGRRAAPPADLIIAGSRYGIPALDGAAGAPPEQSVATAYATGHARLVALRAAAIEQPAGRSVCLEQGSPYAAALAFDKAQGARPKVYASSVHAAYAFMSGECDILAEDDLVLQRLMGREEWRFYKQLPIDVRAAASPQIVLSRPDAESARYLDRVVRHWLSSGVQRQAREDQAGEVNFEVATLQDGMVCHS